VARTKRAVAKSTTGISSRANLATKKVPEAKSRLPRRARNTGKAGLAIRVGNLSGQAAFDK